VAMETTMDYQHASNSKRGASFGGGVGLESVQPPLCTPMDTSISGSKMG